MGSAWSKANPERRKAWLIQWRAKNKLKIAAQQKVRDALNWKLNPEKRMASWRSWAAKNKDKLKRYYKTNYPRLYASQRRWVKNNPERHKASVDARRARKFNCRTGNLRVIAGWEKSWRHKRSVICFWCRSEFRPSECHSDHIIALASGGAHAIENLAISCSRCNHHKNSKSVQKWNEELIQPVLAL